MVDTIDFAAARQFLEKPDDLVILDIIWWSFGDRVLCYSIVGDGRVAGGLDGVPWCYLLVWVLST